MARSIVLFIAAAVIGFGFGCGFVFLTSGSSPPQRASPPAAKRTQGDVIVVVANVQALFDVVNEKPDSVSTVLLTMTSSSVELKNGISLVVETLERQPELGEAAKRAGVSSAIE